MIELGMRFVRLCPICGSEAYSDSVICPECASQLDSECFDSFMARCPKCFYPRISDQYPCKRCSCSGIESSKVHQVYPVARYDGKLGFSIVDSFKFHNRRDLAKVVALYLNRALDVLDSAGKAVVVPIPCSRGRLLRFGWDQMEQVCRYLKRPNISLLRRTDDNLVQQKHLGKSQRQEASGSKFCLEEEVADLDDLKSRKLIVVDDIMTTGSTMDAAISLLEENGFSDVCGATWLAEL